MEKKIELTVTEFQEAISNAITHALQSVRGNDSVISSEFYSREDIMKQFRITPTRFAELTRKEGFPGRVVGRSWLIAKAQFDKWMINNQMGLI